MDDTEAAGKPREGQKARIAALRGLARQAPEAPGVYIMRDAEGLAIYVGKAKVLRNRLSSYFSGRKDVKTRHLVSRVDRFEWIIAGSEYEALLLENTLIKQHAPRYNINLKDGKTYPSVRVTAEEYPRVFRTRRIVHDGSRYFGPFPSAETIDTYLDLVKRLFPLRRCAVMRKRDSPCMYYHIGRCPGPCAGKITREAYAARVGEVEKLLAGETDALLAELRAKMAAASAALQFEEAARLRDAAAAIEQFAGRSSAVDFDPEARDYVAWAADGELVDFVVFQMRGGKLTGRDLYRNRLYAAEEEALQGFLMSYYGPDRLPPPRVFVMGLSPLAASPPAAATQAAAPIAAATPAPDLPAAAPSLGEGLALVSEYFARELGSEVAFAAPAERRHEAAMNLAAHNAREDLAKRRREAGDAAGIADLKERLGLASAPSRIEGFDIAQLSGTHTVASLVSFRDGTPDKKAYRHFKIKSLEGAIDDFGAIREAVARRYTRLVNEGAELPDLVLVDGGAGQVSAAKEILDALGVDCELAGLAKRDEEVWLPGRSEPLRLPKESPALRVLVAVRDETHRFATGLNQRLRASELRFGLLESVEGVGPARARRLLRVFGSLDLMAAATPESIAKAGGMGIEVATKVKEALAGRKGSE